MRCADCYRCVCSLSRGRYFENWPFFGVDRNILKTYVRRVADDGVELLAQRVIEEITDFGARRRDTRVDLDADTIAALPPQLLEEGAIAGRELCRGLSGAILARHACAAWPG